MDEAPLHLSLVEHRWSSGVATSCQGAVTVEEAVLQILLTRLLNQRPTFLEWKGDVFIKVLSMKLERG